MNLLEIFAKLGLDSSEYDKGLSKAAGAAQSFGQKIGSGLATAAKVGGAAIAVASTAVGALVKQSVDAYASYEQLVGGVETLFKESAGLVQQYAANAFKTSGMSANQYMETVTSFSASLLQSVEGDTEKAAKAADVAMRDMSDNANKMGTSMESIMAAYQGFSKQQYQLLDNLKLGYGGTKGEMQRLLADAEKLSGVEYDITNLSDVYEAIHVIQTEIGITGTTAEEAEKTISGSTASMAAAWQNLITGMARDDADFGALVTDFVDSAVAVVGNMAPRIKQALGGVGKLVEGLAPVIAEELPKMMSDLAPSLFDAAVSLLESLGRAIGDNSEKIADIISLVFGMIGKMLSDPKDTGLLTNISKLIETVGKTVVSELPSFLKTVVSGMTEILPELLDTILNLAFTVIDTLTDPEVLGGLVDAAIELIMALADGLISALPQLIDKVPEILDNLIQALSENGPKLFGMGVELWLKLAEGVLEAVPQLLAEIPGIILSIVEGFVAGFGSILQVGKDLVDKVKEGFKEKVEGAKEWGKELIDGFVQGILSKWESLKSKVSGVVDKVKGIFTGKSGFDSHSPSKWAESVFKNVLEGAEVGIANGRKALFESTDDLVGNIQSRFDNDISVTAAPSEGSVYALLLQYLPMLTNQKVVLDSGALVGELTPGIDTALGQRAAFANRRAAT